MKTQAAAAPKRPAAKPTSVVELARMAAGLRAKGGAAATVKLYEEWIAQNEDDPLLYVVLFNYSTVLTEVGAFDRAVQVLEKAIVQNTDFTPAKINLGRALEQTGKPRKAVSLWSNVIDKLSATSGENIYHKTTALNQMARVLEAANQDTVVETLLRQSLELDRTQKEVAQHYLATRQRLCEWPLVQPWDRVSKEDLLSGISPLSMAVYSDDPMLQLALNAHYNQNDVGDPSSEQLISHWAAKEGGDGILRIGYLSSDLREHAIGFLMSEVFELHDRKKVEIYVYYCGIPSEDATMRRIKKAVDHWIPIQKMSDEEAAQRMADDGIQILVDVNGYTRDARTKIVRLRPAPVIVNWLGFPGSMASPYHNYIIADDWIIPPENEKYFSEKVLRLPCYQPNDRKRVVFPQTPTRKEAGLPEKAVVYCSFNGTQKISKFTFDRWLTILERVPDSVLWLLAGTEKSHENLRSYAKTKGVDPERLIFAGKKPNPEHLARYPLADLFLDTGPYGAHTTASDALWMGVPVLTFSGRAFASRVCGSLVRASGLPELACGTAKEYIDRAVALGKDKAARLRYRQKLEAARETCALFDTPALVARLEDLFSQMWGDFKAGKLPQPDLSNLEAYLSVGIQQDSGDVEFQSMKNYEEVWLKSLSKRHKVRPIAVDSRLWTEADRKKAEAGE